VRNVGQGAIDSLLAARKERPFTTLWDLAERVDLRLFNKRVFESLIAAGALDSLGMHRAQLMAVLDQAIGEAMLTQGDKETGQGSLFGDLPEESVAAAPAPRQPPNVPAWSEHDRLQREKEILGFYVSGHPLEPFRTECELFATHTVAQLGNWTPEPVLIGVVVTAIKRQTSKRSGAEYARLTVEDFSGTAEVLVLAEAWAAIADRVRPDIPLLLKGGYFRRDEGVENATFTVTSVSRFTELRASGEFAVVVELRQQPGITPLLLADVRAALEAHPGAAPLELHWMDGGGATRFRSRSLRLAATPLALADLRALLGDEQVRLVRTT
jgi:DNA polymerase-3 subunit alpha